MRGSPILLLLLAIGLEMLTDCRGVDGSPKGASDNDYVEVPRRHAYPRIALPDSTYSFTTAGKSHLVIAVNDAATSTLRSSDDGIACFVDVAYPTLQSTIFYTITPVDRATLSDVIANRLQRIELNMGASDAELLEFDTPAGFECKVFVTRGDISTPVQFLSTDGTNLVVSGAAFVREASPATADSIAPIVDVISRDVVHTLKTMHL